MPQGGLWRCLIPKEDKIALFQPNGSLRHRYSRKVEKVAAGTKGIGVCWKIAGDRGTRPQNHRKINQIGQTIAAGF
jgi:hypothetical protein